ncbi:MAG: hypothetical protein HY673_22030 [Chloroflexi bacterium]|nr:hypothetical protein [Chloroflexota bacterium]
MGKFDGLPDLPPNWLELLQAETLIIQKNMPADPKEAAAKAVKDNLAERQELEEKCPQIAMFLNVSQEALYSGMTQSGVNQEMAARLAGRFMLSTLALLRMLAVSLRGQKK